VDKAFFYMNPSRVNPFFYERLTAKLLSCHVVAHFFDFIKMSNTVGCVQYGLNFA